MPRLIWFPPRTEHLRRPLLSRLHELERAGAIWLWVDEVDGRLAYVVTLVDAARPEVDRFLRRLR